MDGVVSPTSELGVTPVDSLHESPTLDTVAQCNLNDLQSYLVNFNKEIEGNNDPVVSFQSCINKLGAANRQVYVTMPVSSGNTTPDEEQLPLMANDKVEMTSTGVGGIGHMTTGDLSLCAQETTPEELNYEKIENKEDTTSESMDTEGLDSVQVKVSSVEFDDQAHDEEAMETDKIQLQQLSMDQLQASAHSQMTVPEGMVMLPIGDVSTLLGNTDPRLVQIVNVNGQPTLQFVGAPNMLAQSNIEVSSPPQQQTELVSDTPAASQISLLASVAASNGDVVVSGGHPLLSQLHTSQVQALHLPQQTSLSPQLVAVQDTESSQPQVMAVNLEDMMPAVSSQHLAHIGTSSTLITPGTGYQSVAILPSGDGAQQGEVNYVLIVNPTGDNSDKLTASPMVDLSSLQGDTGGGDGTGDKGQGKRYIKINRLLNDVQALEGSTGIVDEMTCNMCDYTSPQRYLLKRHMKSHSADRPHKCNICQRGFKTVSTLTNHINTHTGIRPHKCKLCESAFTTSGELVRHIRYKHTFEKPHKCTMCEYASVELSKLKRHMRSHTGERPYACQYCNYASPDTYKLKRHMRIHTGEKPYQCEVCQAKFTQSNSLKAHRLIHSGNKPVFQCNLCPATCGRNSDLKVHIQKLHGVNDHMLVCKKCNAKFPDRYSFKVHIKSHDGEKCFKCPECDYAAISQRHLDSHVLTHTGVKPFECEDCDLAFRQKQLLKRHRYIYHSTTFNPDEHKDEQCRECEKNFFKKFIDSQDQTIVGDANEIYKELENAASGQQTAGMHTCGGCPKSMMDLAPLTADQLIENSLLADMKEGKLGASPKVVVVHPDGRVEEVTAKLQSLSQSKPMDDFLVSLGVSGDSHFDQVSSLPADVGVAEVNGLITTAGQGDSDVMLDSDVSEGRHVLIKPKPSAIHHEIIPTTDTAGFPSTNVLLAKQLSDDSDEDIDIEGDIRHPQSHIVVNIVPAKPAPQ